MGIRKTVGLRIAFIEQEHRACRSLSHKASGAGLTSYILYPQQLQAGGRTGQREREAALLRG